MALNETIERYEHNAEYERQTGNLQGCMEIRQLVEWLKDYKRLSQEPKQGEWKEQPNPFKCSECGIIRAKGMTGKYNYCPSCGAKMKNGRKTW